MRRRALLALGLALVVLAVFVLAVGWEDVYLATARASLDIYGLAFVGCLFMLISRSRVWYILLSRVDERRPYWLVGSVFLTAMFAKYVTPYGQVTSGVGMAAVVSRYYESAYEESLAAILSADFLNYVPYYTLGGGALAYLLFVDALPASLGAYLLIAGAGVLGLALMVIAIWWGRASVKRTVVNAGRRFRAAIVERSPRIARVLSRENIRSRFQGFSATLGLLSKDRETIVIAAIWAHLAWLGLAGALFSSALAVGVQLSISVTFLSLALSKAGFVIPTPGGVGGVEIALAGVLYLLSPMGVATATAVAILYRFSTYWFTVLLGGISSIALTVADPTPPDS